MFLATKILLGFAFLGLAVAAINFIMTLGRRRREGKELREMQELKDQKELQELQELKDKKEELLRE